MTEHQAVLQPAFTPDMEVTPGEGRLAQCLKKNEQKSSERCQQAMKDTKLVK